LIANNVGRWGSAGRLTITDISTCDNYVMKQADHQKNYQTAVSKSMFPPISPNPLSFLPASPNYR
jgi:hypothetical protein